MKRVLAFALLVGPVSGVACATAADLVDLGWAKGGPIVLHGNMLMAGAVPDTAFHFEAMPKLVRGDTVYVLVINGYRIDLPEPPQPHIVNPRFDADTAVSHASQAFRRARFAATGKEPSQGEIVDFQVREYRKHKDVVRKAYKVSDHEYRVCWVGDAPDDCEGHRLEQVHNVPPTPLQLVQGEASSLKLFLGAGRMVLIRRSGEVFPTQSETAMYVQEYKDLKSGRLLPEKAKMSGDLARQIAQPPIMLESLKIGASKE